MWLYRTTHLEIIWGWSRILRRLLWSQGKADTWTLSKRTFSQWTVTDCFPTDCYRGGGSQGWLTATGLWIKVSALGLGEACTGHMVVVVLATLKFRHPAPNTSENLIYTSCWNCLDGKAISLQVTNDFGWWPSIMVLWTFAIQLAYLLHDNVERSLRWPRHGFWTVSLLQGRMLYWCSATTSVYEGYRGVSTTGGQMYNVFLAWLIAIQVLLLCF